MKKGVKGYMAMKVDLVKAYDRVEWGILRQIILQFGFNSRFMDLVVERVSIVCFYVLLNRSPHGYFKAGRGVWQGDLMSPELFVILLDLLSRMIEAAEQQGRILGIKVARDSP